MRTWLDRLFRRPDPAERFTVMRTPTAGEVRTVEDALATKRRLRGRMLANLHNLPEGPLRRTTLVCMGALDAEILQLEKLNAPDPR